MARLKDDYKSEREMHIAVKQSFREGVSIDKNESNHIGAPDNVDHYRLDVHYKSEIEMYKTARQSVREAVHRDKKKSNLIGLPGNCNELLSENFFSSLKQEDNSKFCDDDDITSVTDGMRSLTLSDSQNKNESLETRQSQNTPLALPGDNNLTGTLTESFESSKKSIMDDKKNLDQSQAVINEPTTKLKNLSNADISLFLGDVNSCDHEGAGDRPTDQEQDVETVIEERVNDGNTVELDFDDILMNEKPEVEPEIVRYLENKKVEQDGMKNVHKSEINSLESKLLQVSNSCTTAKSENSTTVNSYNSYSKSLPKTCSDVKEPRDESINILVVGQSGVGKSTWINSMKNYLMYETLDKAESNGVQKIIPTQFTVTDNDYNTIVVNSDGEVIENVGQAGTTECNRYKLEFNNKIFYIIDTPGVGDPGGLEQDQLNVTQILKYLKKFETISAICLLLKPNESKLGGLFEFCLKEILSHLHKSAVRNIKFCLTNARSTFYKPGETITLLSKIFESMGLDISLDRNNIYCFDNEAYRYLCTMTFDNFTYSDEDVESFGLSWNKSKEETFRFFNNILSITPHQLKNTSALNDARNMLDILLKPMAEIEEKIIFNLVMIEKQMRNIEHFGNYDHWDCWKVEMGPIEYHEPKIACYQCSSVVPLKHTKYENKIYRVCYQGRNHKKFFNELLNAGRCDVCKCSSDFHFPKYQTQVFVEVPFFEPDYLKMIKSNKDKKNQHELLKKKLMERQKDLLLEKRKILQTSIKCDYLLKKYSLSSKNNLMLEHLESLADKELQKINASENYNDSIYNELDKSICQYKKNYKEFTKNIEGLDINIDEFYKWQDELFKLPEHGELFKQLMNFHQKYDG